MAELPWIVAKKAPNVRAVSLHLERLDSVVNFTSI